MADEEEIVISLEGEADSGTEDAAVNDLASQFKELQGRLESESQARAAAERRAADEQRVAAQARQEATAARGEATDHQYETVSTGLAAAQAEATAAEADYAAAMEAGDFARAAKAQRRMASAEAKAVRLDEAKSDLEARRTAPEKTVQRTEAPQGDDPVERYIQGRSEPTANWLRSHREFITDPRKNAKLTAAHWSAMGEGLSVDTKEYFDHVEQSLGLKQALTNGAGKPPARKPAAPPAAPVNGSGGGSHGGGGTVTLTKGEASAATDGTHVWNYDDPSPNKRFKRGDPIGVQEFARRKLALQKQGAYDRSYVES
jgi:hypothetical protein